MNSKKILKEKVVQMYEYLFQGEDLLKQNPHFWEEIFLLKPNISYLKSEIQRICHNDLIKLKPILNKFFKECVQTLGHTHHIRIFNALQTLCILISSMYKKNFQDNEFDVINILIGLEFIEESMHQLSLRCSEILTEKWPSNLKSICLNLILVIVSVDDNINRNALLQYLLIHNVFETAVKLLCNMDDRVKFGQDIVVLLTLLINYKKYEIVNPLVVKLSILDHEPALNGYGLVMTRYLINFCRHFTVQQSETSSSKWLVSLTSIVENVFISKEDHSRLQQIKSNNGVILSLYQMIHLNRNFITVLTRILDDSEIESLLINEKYSSQQNKSTPATVAPVPEPLNLFVILLQYCSIIMQDTKSEENNNNVKLCFIILTYITEDQYASSIIHNVELTFKVQLFRMPMRHRQVIQEKAMQPMAATLMDLLIEFIISHMMKKLPAELYFQCIGLIHRLICYQKKNTIRLNYNWIELWEALITLLKFLHTNENCFLNKFNIVNLAFQIVNILNLFITYGDTFLSSPQCYDFLYYEIIRMHDVFDNLNSLILKYSSVDDEIETNVKKLINIRAIIHHFKPKIEKWVHEQGYSTPTEEEILNILRKNYGTLTLKLLDNLDQYERYSEKSIYSSFFSILIYNAIVELRQNIDYTNLDFHTILEEFSAIS